MTPVKLMYAVTSQPYMLAISTSDYKQQIKSFEIRKMRQ